MVHNVDSPSSNVASPGRGDNRTNGAPKRTITRARSLPSRRAMLGALLITAAAVITFSAYQGARSAPATSFAIATRSVDAGERLGPDDVELVAIDLPSGVSQHALPSISELDGATALAPLRAGQLVQRSEILPPAPGEAADSPPSQEFSFSLPRAQALNGTLNRGESVDVLATYGTAESAQTWVVVRGAVVSSVENGSGGTLGADATVTITLRVAGPAEVLRLTHAKDSATVTLVRTSRSAGIEAGPDHYSGPGSEPASAPGRPATGGGDGD